MKKTLGTIVWVLILLTSITYHFISTSELKKDYNDMRIVYENCVEFRKEYVLKSDSIFTQYEDSLKTLKTLNLRIDYLESELTR